MTMQTIQWPDLRFPPINLWNAPLLSIRRNEHRVVEAQAPKRIRVAPTTVIARLTAMR